ncbi:hypothetical protein [Bacillus cereus group sp. Bce015]|uniref:hypothetical protein n=1 Tax=Bacillus cereus group sp. Bce015 TaxID=3445249 RepID=UPI003F22E5F6
MEENIRDIVVKEVIWSIMRHNTQGYTEENLGTETRILDIFPSKHIEDEQSNAFGLSLLEAWRAICNQCGIIDEPIGYDPREEFELFTVLEDVMKYFTNWTLLNLEEE